MSSTEERMSATECKVKTGPASDGLKDLRGSHGRHLSLSLSPLALSEGVLSHNEIGDHSHNVMSPSEGISESEGNFTLIYEGSGNFFCKNHNKSRSYSYPMSSSSSPPWSPYCSTEPKSEAAIPFAWEDRPGVPKQDKAPTPRSCFGELPRPPPLSSTSKFSIRRPKQRAEEVDPFVLALVECTKQAAAAAAAVSNMSKDAQPRRCGFTYLLHEFLRRHRRRSVINSGSCKTIEQAEQQLEKNTEIASNLEVC